MSPFIIFHASPDCIEDLTDLISNLTTLPQHKILNNRAPSYLQDSKEKHHGSFTIYLYVRKRFWQSMWNTRIRSWNAIILNLQHFKQIHILLIKHNRYLWMTHSPTTVKPHRLFCWVWQSLAHGWWTAVKSSWRMMEAGWRPVVCHTPLSPIKKEQKKHARLELHTKYCEKFVVQNSQKDS